jgi:general secretion pathway protein G
MLGMPMGQRGLTLIELVIALAILGVLAAAILPMAEVTVTRTKEIELRRSLRTIRTAIDQYKEDYERAIGAKKILTSINETGYPESLEDLLRGTDWGGLYAYKKKYLRRIPKDPFDSYGEGWGMRSLEDDPDSTVWGGGNIYDVYSQSDAIGLDGTAYNTW